MSLPEQPAPRKKLDSIMLYNACQSKDANVQRAAYKELWKYLYPRVLFLIANQKDADALSEDCCQETLIRIYERIGELREPAAFLWWARRIAINLAKDVLKKRRRFFPIDDVEHVVDPASFKDLGEDNNDELIQLINRAPMSDLSRRVVSGRYVYDKPDEELAASESIRVTRKVLPSHIQVTRSKNLAKLRSWPYLKDYLI